MHNDSTLVEENQRFVRKGLINIIKSLSKQLEQVTRERDAAIKDMYHASSDGGSFCDICVYKNNGCDERKVRDIECFEWRGVEVE